MGGSNGAILIIALSIYSILISLYTFKVAGDNPVYLLPIIPDLGVMYHYSNIIVSMGSGTISLPPELSTIQLASRGVVLLFILTHIATAHVIAYQYRKTLEKVGSSDLWVYPQKR